MNIKIITEDNLLKIKKNLETISENVFHKKEQTIENIIGSESVLVNTDINIEQFELLMNKPSEQKALTDIDNIEILYSKLKFLSDSQASDERLWASLCLYQFRDYMKYRWGNSAIDLKNHYIFGYSKQRSLFRNGIARLWWIGRLTYDDTNIDPFTLTRFMCQYQDLIETICGRNIFNNKNFCLGFLSALHDLYTEGLKIDRKLIRNIAKYANLLSGTYILDMLSRDEVYQKFTDEIKRLKEMEEIK